MKKGERGPSIRPTEATRQRGAIPGANLSAEGPGDATYERRSADTLRRLGPLSYGRLMAISGRIIEIIWQTTSIFCYFSDFRSRSTWLF
jgi:hypothetical protein